MDDLAAYVILYFSHLMTAQEQRAHKHLMSAMPLTESEQALCNGIAWEEAMGNALPEDCKAFMFERQSGLSDDPEVLRLASGGLEAFLERTAARIIDADRDHIFLNNCPICGALARTPQARQCRFCGHDWHGDPRGKPRTE